MGELAGTIVSLASLLIDYRATKETKRRSDQEDDIGHFLEWLRRNDHAETVGLLEANGQMSAAIAEMLAANHEELVARVTNLDEALRQILLYVSGWGAVARAMPP